MSIEQRLYSPKYTSDPIQTMAAAKTTSLSSSSSSSSSSSKDATMKSRIITHMNADHAFSLSLYLQHHCALPAPQSHPAVLTDITPDYMLISAPRAGTTNVVPFTPPLTSLAQTRERVVTMHRAALSALDMSETQITEWKPPDRLWQWALAALCLWCYPTLLFPGSITSQVNGLSYKVWSLGGLAPWFAALTHRFALYAWTFMVVAHAGETWYLVATKLRRHRVPFGGGAWWAWVGNCLLSGAGAITRFDGLVREKEEKAGKGGKH